MENYEIKLDRRVLKQLGSQLYGDTPSVISELVAIVMMPMPAMYGLQLIQREIMSLLKTMEKE